MLISCLKVSHKEKIRPADCSAQAKRGTIGGKFASKEALDSDGIHDRHDDPPDNRSTIVPLSSRVLCGMDPPLRWRRGSDSKVSTDFNSGTNNTPVNVSPFHWHQRGIQSNRQDKARAG